ncbi:hypothetical protein [Draconibacterium halophilum]|uniref:Uncharacterized protein n=1 Tax=Draconibacterium halophilum TaxID=2706887 RepID=A0A6C0R9Q6_9BACT|nr:hypothetical protein [Draconibacterium halophilum]QIA06682.1 hypothetical protein G0Q07_02570 [Draconibacterium halophilum]
MATIHLGAFVYFFSKIKEIASGEIINDTIAWIPQLGINIELVLGGLGLAFALLITGTGVLVFFTPMHT